MSLISENMPYKLLLVNKVLYCSVYNSNHVSITDIIDIQKLWCVQVCSVMGRIQVRIDSNHDLPIMCFDLEGNVFASDFILFRRKLKCRSFDMIAFANNVI